MHSLIDGAIGLARMVVAIFVVAFISGMITYVSLPKEADPDIPIPFVVVTIPLEGVSPEDAERLLIRPSETELRSIEGLVELNSVATEGAGTIILEFGVSFDQDQALLDVREKMDLAESDFPEDARPPIITELNAATFPVLVINIYGQAPERGLNRIARNLQEELETISGVLEANIQGEREEVLEIIVDPIKLETYNLSYQDVLASVSANNRLIPAGRIAMEEGRFAVKVPGLLKTAEDAFNLPVIESGDAVVTLSDVADIRRTFKDRDVYAQFNGDPSVSIEIVKRTGANILDTVEEVKTALARAEAEWPTTVRASVTSDMSDVISNQLGQLQSSIITAVVLVMIIVVAALGLRSAGLVGIAIPASFLMAFLLLGVFGYTINMMVMFGMVIAVGILVDGAIVVVEYADRKMAEGLPRQDAFAMAGKRMFWPVVASNATTLAAFVPFLFWDSIPGKFMAYLPITLIFVLSASLVMALIFLPVLGSVLGGRAHQDDNEDLKALSGVDGDPRQAKGWLGRYVNTLAALMKRPLTTTACAFGIIIMIFTWFGLTPHKTEFFLDTEPEQLYVFVRAQGNLSATEEQHLVKSVEQRISGVDGIESISTRSGNAGGNLSADFFVGDVPRDTIGRILIELREHADGYDGRVIEENIRNAIYNIPGVQTELQRLEQGPPTGKDIQLILRASDADALEETARTVRAHVNSVEGLREIADTLPLPGIEYQLRVDRVEAAKFGVDVSQIGAAVQLVTNGILVGKYRPDDALDELDIRVRLPDSERSVEAIDELKIATPLGQVPISLFVDRVPTPLVDQIVRRDGKRIIEIKANVIEQGTGPQKIEELQSWIDSANLDPNVEITFGGADEDSAEAAAFFRFAGLAALFLMAIILLWEFNNFYHVLLTLSAVVLSVAGVLVGIQLILPYISILMIGTGVVALAGIVVNNNIVMIDTFQRLRRDGRTAEDAALATAAQRVRPILLTTLTTICGLLPMVFMVNVDFAKGAISFGGVTAEWWVPLATAVVFGLGFSTMMALLVTPVWLTAPEKMGRLRDRLLGHNTERSAVSVVDAPARPHDTLKPAAE